jgi:hypothetical protein
MRARQLRDPQTGSVAEEQLRMALATGMIEVVNVAGR